jgi:peptidoglycan/LPS O-acetylase OafA/YrhL
MGHQTMLPNIDTKFLNGIRFLLALWVLVGHFYTYAGGTFFYVFPNPIQVFIINIMAVEGFMILSGFLMAYNYFTRSDKEQYNKNSTIKAFWMRRFFRLYPVYLLSHNSRLFYFY